MNLLRLLSLSLAVVCFAPFLASTETVTVASTTTTDTSDTTNDTREQYSREQQRQHVTVIGLGGMGSAIAKCFASHQQQQQEQRTEQHQQDPQHQQDFVVHVWTRSGGPGGLDDEEDSSDSFRHQQQQRNIRIHTTAVDAIVASPIVVVAIDDWDGVVSFVHEHQHTLSSSYDDMNRTVVLFSTYSPMDIQDLSSSLSQSGGDRTSSMVHLVGGAIVGVPSTICTPRTLIMTSSNVSALEPLGTTVVLESKHNNKNDVGTAALMNMALVVTIFFGLVGHELAHLMISRYGASTEFEQTYQQLASDVAVAYTQMLLPGTSRAMMTTDFHRMYAPTSAVLRLLRLVVKLKDHLGITNDTFLDAHIRLLELIDNPTEDGPPSWTRHAVANDPTTSSSCPQPR